MIVPGKLLASGAVPAHIYERHGPARDAFAWPGERTIMRCMKTRLGREPPGARTWRAARLRARSRPREIDGMPRLSTARRRNRMPRCDGGVVSASLPGIGPAGGPARARPGYRGRHRAGRLRRRARPVARAADSDPALAYLRWSVVRRSRSAPPLASAGGTSEPGSAVVSALRTLSARQREVVVLRYFADLPEAEIASATGMSVAAVRKHAARAMSSLRAGLGLPSRRRDQPARAPTPPAGTASRRPVPAPVHRADYRDATWLMSITTRSGPVRLETW